MVGDAFDPIYQNLEKKAMEDENEELRVVVSSPKNKSIYRPNSESQSISRDILKSILSDPSIGSGADEDELAQIAEDIDDMDEITEL